MDAHLQILGPEYQNSTLATVFLQFNFPKNFDSWYFNIDMSPYTESAPTTLTLTQDLIITAFPKEDLQLSSVGLEEPDKSIPFVLFEDSICLLQLNAYILGADSASESGPLLRLQTQAPVTPESEWTIMNADRKPIEILAKAGARNTWEEMTRFYAQNKPWSRYQFGPIIDGTWIHRVHFVSAP